MVSLAKNPYTWDKEGTGKLISPTIPSAKFVADGSEMVVQNLPPGEETIVEVQTPSIKFVSSKLSFLNHVHSYTTLSKRQMMHDVFLTCRKRFIIC